MLLVTILLGLNVNVSNGNKEISYSSAGLLEITLLVVGTASGTYALKQHGNKIGS